MQRAFIIVLDSLGIGGAEDADKFGDRGSDTLGHIATYCERGAANHKRSGPLKIPHLTSLGLAKAAEQSTGRSPPGLNKQAEIIGAYAYASEISSGKDTQSGHWEIAGVPVLFNWGYFPKKENSFPQVLLKELVTRADLTGFLGNCHASGTIIIDQFGEEHMHTGKPIFYTSTDSVFQVACHEETFGLKRLYYLCNIAREILIDGGYNIGRVIARPFIGAKAGRFERTGNRYDLSMLPTSDTVLQKLVEEKQGTVVSVGKIADIYAQVGISKKVRATGFDALFEATVQEMNAARDNTLVFTNFVDFDSNYGHRRDVIGYATALELFDYRLPELMSQVKNNDVLIITADHGCDPTWHGTDHTREHVPVLIYGPKVNPGFYGHRTTFADISQTVARYFGLSAMNYGEAIM
ncbi:phosphopentomutase [Sodalis endosymbiont of Henestaris halophilus]|uniref:phosphopentomutase n=1 Tax=Sodalis endosymbiont of Henestaris halophilus TaxID=1929246 RepID=UPI000BC0E0E9|nr:phosphopentomutase [Sodalis endosymbiont of Henestaris halophilus]SNC58581.1 Phosphopentomutase [Sodalis endosymbiont of Henestaris halophilus]